jgi:ABC-type hemin transport system substrate-binding protein
MSVSGLRVVSLVPSSTETLLALGANVVACTRFCEQPTIPRVGGTKNPDVESIVRLAPDLVVMDQEENRREDADAFRRAGLTLYVSDVKTISEAMAVVAELASLVGRVSQPVQALVVASEVSLSRRLVLVPIWRRPWMAIGPSTYGGSLLDHLGLSLVTFGGGMAYPSFDLSELDSYQPDLILVPSEPYEFSDAHLDEMRAACNDAAIVRVDGRDLFWWGIRTPAAIIRLSAQLSGLE